MDKMGGIFRGNHWGPLKMFESLKFIVVLALKVTLNNHCFDFWYFKNSGVTFLNRIITTNLTFTNTNHRA